MSRSLRNSIGVAVSVLLALTLLVWIARSHAEHPLDRTVTDRSTAPNAIVPEPDVALGKLAPPDSAPARVVAAPMVTSTRADAPDPGEVLGHVTNEDGRPIAGVALRIEPRFGRVRDCDTDADGAFTFAGLRLEEVNLRTVTDEYVPVRTSVLLTIEEPRATLDLVLVKACRLRIGLESRDGTRLPSDVHPDAALIRFVDVRFIRRRPEIGSELDASQMVAPLTSRADSEDLTPGVWRTVVAPGRRNLFACLVLSPWVLDVQPVPLEGDSLVLVADIDAVRAKLGHIVMTVVDDATGSSIRGARVVRRSWTGSGDDLLGTTDEKGWCRSQDQVPGKVEIVITHDDHLWTRMVCTIGSGADTDLGLIRLSRGIELTGRVEFADGSTARTQLRCRRIEFMDGNADTLDDKTVMCEPDGTFRFAALHTGQYVIGPVEAMHPPGRDRNEPARNDLRLNVDASEGSVSGLVLRLPHAGGSDRAGKR